VRATTLGQAILGQAGSHELQLRLTTHADMSFMRGKLDKRDAGECFERAYVVDRGDGEEAVRRKEMRVSGSLRSQSGLGPRSG
jgi:hypothetical protein